MEELKYKYILSLVIEEPNDSRQNHTQTIPITSSYPISSSNGIISIHVSRPRAGYQQKGEPIINTLGSELSKKFGWGRKRNHRFIHFDPTPDDFDILFELGHEEKGFVMVSRKQPHYELMGLRTGKRNLKTALSRVLYRSCFEENGSVLGRYLMYMITLPENVSYALENRAPYDFFNNGKRVESSLNVKRISVTKYSVVLPRLFSTRGSRLAHLSRA